MKRVLYDYQLICFKMMSCFILGLRRVYIDTAWGPYEVPSYMYSMKAKTSTQGLKSVLCRTGLYFIFIEIKNTMKSVLCGIGLDVRTAN